MRATSIVCCIAALIAVAGCGEPVTVYEPGVYKGETDPLLAKQASPEQQARLQERFRTGQTDR